MFITPDPTYSRIGLSLHLYLLGFKRLSLTYKSALPYHTQSTYGVSGPTSLSSYTPLPLLSLLILYLPSLFYSTRDRRSRVGSYFALFSLYTHFTYIPSLYHPYIVRVKISSHPISKIGGYLYYTPSLYYPLFLFSFIIISLI